MGAFSFFVNPAARARSATSPNASARRCSAARLLSASDPERVLPPSP